MPTVGDHSDRILKTSPLAGGTMYSSGVGRTVRPFC